MIGLNHMRTLMGADIFKNVRRGADQAPAIADMAFALSRDRAAPAACLVADAHLADPFAEFCGIMMGCGFKLSPRFADQQAPDTSGKALRIRGGHDDPAPGPVDFSTGVSGRADKTVEIALKQDICAGHERLRRWQAFQLHIDPVALIPDEGLRLRESVQARNDDMNLSVRRFDFEGDAPGPA